MLHIPRGHLNIGESTAFDTDIHVIALMDGFDEKFMMDTGIQMDCKKLMYCTILLVKWVMEIQ